MLLDKQGDAHNENLKIKVPGFTQALLKVYDGSKELPIKMTAP